MSPRRGRSRFGFVMTYWASNFIIRVGAIVFGCITFVSFADVVVGVGVVGLEIYSFGTGTWFGGGVFSA